MNGKRRAKRRGVIVASMAAAAILLAMLFSVYMIRGINQRMKESAAFNLLSTTQMIESTMKNAIDQDFASLKMIGEFYRNGQTLDEGQVDSLCSTMGFERIATVDARGEGVDWGAGRFRAADLPCYAAWTPGEQGYSDMYLGDAGRAQMTLWQPIHRDGALIGTVFGDVLLSKYYSANVFTFYDGEGRTYLFDSGDGQWILRSLGADGVSRRVDDIYTLLRDSGNAEAAVQTFREAIEAGKTGTAVLQFNEKTAYICFMPLRDSPGWYVASVIANDSLLHESTQVQQMIRVTLAVFCAALLLSAGIFAVWQVRRAREQEAAYREALFLNVSANIDCTFLIYEKGSRRTAFVSENVGRLLGLDRAWLGADAGRLFDWCGIPADDPLRVAFLSGALEQAAVREVCVENELGQRARYIRLELIPADLGQEIAVATDITKEKDVQRSLTEAMQRAEQASHAKNDFLSAMSHDIRTPMNGIVGMTAIAAAHLDDRERVHDCLSKISEASAHLLTIINEVLDMSQIESGRLELSCEPFNLPESLQETLDMNYPGIRQKNHTLHVHIDAMEHEQVIGDPARLQRIVSNLLSNAIKYTPDGGEITLRLCEREPVIKGYGRYELSVQDNGIGMSPAFQQKLFQPFEREEDVRISRIQGTGLGMAIVKNLVSLMMGDIQVESEKQGGTTFRVTVNLQLDEQLEARDGALHNLPVLVVDDDRVTCASVSAMLCDIGMVGEWVDNGPDAIRRTTARHQRGEDYLAVLLDWKMPGMDGLETARRIRAAVGPDVPILILTAYEWREIEDEARAAGIHAFLAKPLYKAKLLREMSLLAADQAPVQELPRSAGVLPAGKRVLLVEDNRLNQEIAAELLRMLHVAVDCAEDGAAALARMAESAAGTYDLILMDIQMPRMNGYQAARAIRELDRSDCRQVPIVAMTADAFPKDVQAAYAAGMDDHLAKPVSLERLLRVLRRFFGTFGVEEEGGSDET